MWVFLIFVWLLVLGWGFFFYPCGLIFTLRGETCWIQDLVFHGCWVQCAFRFVFANKPGTDCPLRSSFLCVVHIATACEFKLREHPKATVKSSSTELWGHCLHLRYIAGIPKGFAIWKAEAGWAAWEWDAMRQCCSYQDDNSCPVTFLQTWST